MKKILFLSVFAILGAFVTLESCKKSEAVDASNSSQSEQFYDGDEYDKGLVVEEPDEVEEVEIDDTDYQSEASKSTKIDSIRPFSSGSIAILLPFGSAWQCNQTPYKYAGRYITRNTSVTGLGVKKYIIYLNRPPTTDFTTIVGNKDTYLTISDLTKIDSTKYSFIVNDDKEATYIKTLSLKITISNGAESKSKSIKMVGTMLGNYLYGTHLFGVVYERKLLGKETNLNAATPTPIDSTYIPQIGDVVFFVENTRSGVVSKQKPYPATKTRPARSAIKLVEYNALCNFKKTTKSLNVNVGSLPISADGSTATGYFRD